MKAALRASEPIVHPEEANHSRRAGSLVGSPPQNSPAKHFLEFAGGIAVMSGAELHMRRAISRAELTP